MSGQDGSRQNGAENRPSTRASQACTRCRSRKIRCDGVHPVCSTCASSTTECVWPLLPNRRGRRSVNAVSTSSARSTGRGRRSVAASPSPAVRHAPTSSDVAVDRSNITAVAPLNHEGQAESAPEKPNWLRHGLVLPDRRGMVQLWEIFLRSTYIEVFGVFHKPTVTSQILRGQLSPELALGICMHAARFSTIEIAKHGNPLAASNFYGDAAATFLLSRSSMATLDSIIAMLLLTLHEFSMKRGREAWFHLGIAIRAVLSLDLGKEVSEDRLTSSPLYAPWKTRECRRRCFWSAFIIERIIATGNHPMNLLSGSPGLPRHHLIDLKDVNVQLPSPENDFMFFRPVLTHNSAELGNRSFPSGLPPGDNTATAGHLIKVCKIWGDLSRWAFAPTISKNLETNVLAAFNSFTQWHFELPERSKWNFENYSAHSVPGVALGGSYIFMHLVSGIGFVLLGLKSFDYSTTENLSLAAFRSRDEDPRTFHHNSSYQVLKKATESAKFILDISNDPMNLLGTTFLDYALYLASILMMKLDLLQASVPLTLDSQKLGTISFLYRVFSVYKRRIHYWKLTRAYSRVLRAAYEEFVQARNQGLHIYEFQTSTEYGSIENMENRDMELDNEAKDITELQSKLVSESSSPSNAVVPTPNDMSAGLDPSQGFEILDIDSLLAAQNAADAIQVSLSTTNDGWWNDLFGEEPANMDHDFLSEQYMGMDMAALF